MNKVGIAVLVLAIFGGVLITFLLEQKPVFPGSGPSGSGTQTPLQPGISDPESGAENGTGCIGSGCGTPAADSGSGAGSPADGGGAGSGSGSGPAGNGTNETTEPENFTCTYSYNETIGSGSAMYVNNGCENPLPTCSPSGTCVPCGSASDCVQLRISTFVTGSENQESTVHFYSSAGSSLEGSHNSLTNACVIQDNSGMLSSESVSQEQCLEQFTGYLTCQSGLCS